MDDTRNLARRARDYVSVYGSIALLAACVCGAKGRTERVNLFPRLQAGQTLAYQISYHSDKHVKTESPVIVAKLTSMPCCVSKFSVFKRGVTAESFTCAQNLKGSGPILISRFPTSSRPRLKCKNKIPTENLSSLRFFRTAASIKSPGSTRFSPNNNKPGRSGRPAFCSPQDSAPQESASRKNGIPKKLRHLLHPSPAFAGCASPPTSVMSPAGLCS